MIEKTIDVIIPCYNEEDNIRAVYEETCRVETEILGYSFKYIFINDGSSDGTLDAIRELAAGDKRVKYISFSRNFGKEAAMYAGICNSKGDYAVIMDADLQHPPALLPEMHRMITEEGYDCCGGKRHGREGDSVIRKTLSEMFYRVYRGLTGMKTESGCGDFRMMKRQVAEAILSMKEYNRFSKGIFSWVGFNTKYLSYSNVQRVAGKSDWTIWQLFKYAMDGISDFSQAPLNITLWLGFVSFIVSFFAIIFIVVRHWIFPQYAINGWSSLVCIILLIGGLQLLCIGLVGRYIGRIYLQVKRRPIYIIKEKK